MRRDVSNRNEAEEIPLLKAISVRNILMIPDTGSCKKYFPLIAKRLRMKEAAVRYVWLHRNEVLEEWDNCVPYNPRISLNKVWMHSFLYGWVGCRRKVIDYSVISAVAKEWASRSHSKEARKQDPSNFKIQSGRKMLQFSPLNRKTDLSKTTWKMLNQQVSDYLQLYRNELERTKIITKKIKKSRGVRELKTKSNSNDNCVQHGLAEMEKLIYDSFSELLTRFFVPDKIISQMGKRFLSTSQLQWKTYIRKHIRTTRFFESFRKKYNLVTAADDSHQLYPFSIPILLKKIFIKLDRLEVRPQVMRVSLPSPLPFPSDSSEHDNGCNECPHSDEPSGQNSVGKIPSMSESFSCDSGSQPPVKRKPNNNTSRIRKPTSCRSKDKDGGRHGKRWRDVVKCSQECSSPNEETMSQISDFVSKTLVEEMAGNVELAPLYSVLQEDPFVESYGAETVLEHAHEKDNVTAAICTTASEELDTQEYQDEVTKSIADLSSNDTQLDNQPNSLDSNNNHMEPLPVPVDMNTFLDELFRVDFTMY